MTVFGLLRNVWNRFRYPALASFHDAPRTMVGDPITEALATYRYCPCVMEPCACTAETQCQQQGVSLTREQVAYVREMKVAVGRQCQWLRRAAFTLAQDE